MRTSFHHQPEAQHPHKYAGRLPHLFGRCRDENNLGGLVARDQRRECDDASTSSEVGFKGANRENVYSE
jgi:hypothetical protein